MHTCTDACLCVFERVYLVSSYRETLKLASRRYKQIHLQFFIYSIKFYLNFGFVFPSLFYMIKLRHENEGERERVNQRIKESWIENKN